MASCTIDFCKGPCFHGFRKAEARISINDYDGDSEEFIVEGEGGPSPLTPLPIGLGEGNRLRRGCRRSLSPQPSLHRMETGVWPFVIHLMERKRAESNGRSHFLPLWSKPLVEQSGRKLVRSAEAHSS